MAGIRLIAKFLNDLGKYKVIIEQADNPWNSGPELLDGEEVRL